MNINPEQIPDEVVEAALNAFNTFPCPNPGSITSCFNDEQMKAALAAALPVLLGEPVAWMGMSNGDTVTNEYRQWYAKHYPRGEVVERYSTALYTLPTQDTPDEQ